MDELIYCRTCGLLIAELDKMVKYDPGDYECIDCYCLSIDRATDMAKEDKIG